MIGVLSLVVLMEMNFYEEISVFYLECRELLIFIEFTFLHF